MSKVLTVSANRQLEDIDAYYRTNPSLIVTRNKEATMTKRPLQYIEHENELLRRTRGGMKGEVEVEHDA